MTIKEWSKEVHENAVAHGWCETQRNVGEAISLMHSELSEALEEWRSGHPLQQVYPNFVKGEAKPEGFGIELADCMIRIMQYSEEIGIDIQAMIEIKHAYNVTRPYRHGGKLA